MQNGNFVIQSLEGQLVWPANVLDWLLAHPSEIPEEWKGKFVFFWGTIYRNPAGYLYVRCLRWSGVRWYWYYRWLVGGWLSDNPAAVLAS